MIARRVLPVCLAAVLCLGIRADDDLPPDAKKLVEDHEKASAAVLKKAEDQLRKAQQESDKAQEEVRQAKKKLIEQLTALSARLAKEGKTNQAEEVADKVEELKTGRIAGSQPDPGTLGAFRAQAGKAFLFEVVGRGNGSIWGTDTYTDDTDLGTAAVHAGVLREGVKGVVKVTILGPQQSFEGTIRNGITSSGYGPWSGSYKVELGKKIKSQPVAVAPGEAKPDPGNLLNHRGQLGKTFLFIVTGKTDGSVWGSDVYTDDSELATAAVHAGVLKNGEKGIVKVTILPGQQAYVGAERNGVKTGDWPEYSGSFKVEPAPPAPKK